MNILNRIKIILNSKGFTIKELERKANVGNGTIRRWGECAPSADKLQRVAKYLNVSIDYLITGEEEVISVENKMIIKNLKKLSSSNMKLVSDLIKALSN